MSKEHFIHGKHDDGHHAGKVASVRKEQAADFDLEDWQEYRSIGHLMWEYGLTEEDIKAAGGCLDDAIRLKIEGYGEESQMDSDY